MGTRSFIAIKKRRPTSQQQQQQSSKQKLKESEASSRENSSPTPEKSEYDELKERYYKAYAYVRENFVVWQYNQLDGFFEFQGVGVFKFLRKFLDEWSDEQRREYIDNLDLIEECDDDLRKESDNWYKTKYSEIGGILDKCLMEVLADREFLEYMPICRECGYQIFEILAAKKGRVKTLFTGPNWPLDSVFCHFGYIVDFDESELHVLFCNPESELSSCELLKPVEEIFGRRGLVLSTKFKFSELPRTEREFVEIVCNNSCDSDDDSNGSSMSEEESDVSEERGESDRSRMELDEHESSASAVEDGPSNGSEREEDSDRSRMDLNRDGEQPIINPPQPGQENNQ